MKTVVIILLILGIGNLILAIRRNKHDEDHIFAKSEKRLNKSIVKTIDDMQHLSKDVYRQEILGFKDTKEQDRMQQLSDRLHQQTNPLGSFEKGSAKTTGPLKRF